MPTVWPYRFQHHVEGVRGVPHIIANPNPDGYINPILEWDTNNPIDGIAWSATGFGADNHLFGAVYGILDTGPESLVPTWPAVLRRRVPGAVRGQVVVLRAQHRDGPERLSEAREPRRARAPERRRVLQRRQDHVHRRLRRGVHRLRDALAVLHRAQVRRDLDGHAHRQDEAEGAGAPRPAGGAPARGPPDEQDSDAGRASAPLARPPAARDRRGVAARAAGQARRRGPAIATSTSRSAWCRAGSARPIWRWPRPISATRRRRGRAGTRAAGASIRRRGS